MKELSLFTGAGGGVLGAKLLGWQTTGYVEIDKYCQKIIAQRIKDGLLDEAPIFGDIRTFISEGFAASYKGLVDVITAGFPCQPFSVAGKRLGEKDSRNMWPETIECIRIIRPQFTLLENVPGLLAHPYARRIFGDMAESGYDARWRVLSAAEMGAPHKRDRLWIVAYAEGGKNIGRKRKYMVETAERWKSINSSIEPCGEDVPNAPRMRELQSKGSQQNQRKWISNNRWWPAEPDVGRVAHGVASRMDRLKALGNGQVSGVVATAWMLLNEE